MTLLCASALGIFSHAQVAGEDKFTTAFREIKRNDSLQFDFTNAPPPPPKPETPKWLQAIADFFGDIFGAFGGFFDGLSFVFISIFYGIFWLGVGALVMVVLYLLATTIMAADLGSKNQKAEASPPPLYQPKKAQGRILLNEIDALAAQGKYAEAIHTLLFRSIQDIDANRPNVIRRSLTSREIGDLTILTPKARQVFSNIASIVERSFFGGQDIGEANFYTARAAYTELVSQVDQWALGHDVILNKDQVA